MFIREESGSVALTKENLQMAGLVGVFVIAFAVFMAMMIFLLFKIVYKKVESRFLESLNSKLAPTGIRPISYFIPPEMDSRLEESYQLRRGTLPDSTVQKVAAKNAVRFA